MTAQQPDRILIEGEEWSLLATPLDAYLQRVGPRAPAFVAPHTANWRGYTATWAVEGGRLHLVDVAGTISGAGGRHEPVSGSDAIGGASLPLVAEWVTGQLRIGAGRQVRHVHAGFDSRWEREEVLDVVEGRIVGRQRLAEPAAMGTAGPYQLHEPLLGDLSGGAFAQLIAATDLDGRPLVAKAPRARGGGVSATEMWIDTPDGRRPLHLPAVALIASPDGGLHIDEVHGDVLADVLRNEASILERDDGVLLPTSYGLWQHDPSGLPVLVMERLTGRQPMTVDDVRAILQTLDDAVRRGTFDAHGDVKLEHVFIDGGRVRLCDPAPRFDEPRRRAFTPLYNPAGLTGPAADVAACATILRYLPGATATGWRWCAAVLDGPTPPLWASSHAAALRELDAELAAPVPPPPGWTVPPLPRRTAGLGVAPPPAAQALPVSAPSVPVYTPSLPTTTATVEPLHETVRRLTDDVDQLRATLAWLARSSGHGPAPQLVAELDRLAVTVDALLAARRALLGGPPAGGPASFPPPLPPPPPPPTSG